MPPGTIHSFPQQRRTVLYYDIPTSSSSSEYPKAMPSSTKKHTSVHPRSHNAKPARSHYMRGNDAAMKKRRSSIPITDNVSVRNGPYMRPAHEIPIARPIPISIPIKQPSERRNSQYSKTRNASLPPHHENHNHNKLVRQEEANKKKEPANDMNGMSYNTTHPPHQPHPTHPMQATHPTHPTHPAQHYSLMHLQSHASPQELHDGAGAGAAHPGEAMMCNTSAAAHVLSGGPAIHHHSNQFPFPINIPISTAPQHHPQLPADPKLSAPMTMPHSPHEMYYNHNNNHNHNGNHQRPPPPSMYSPYHHRPHVERGRPVFFNMPPITNVEYENWVILDVWGYGGWVKVPVNDPPARRSFTFHSMGLQQARPGEKVLYRVYYPSHY